MRLTLRVLSLISSNQNGGSDAKFSYSLRRGYRNCDHWSSYPGFLSEARRSSLCHRIGAGLIT